MYFSQVRIDPNDPETVLYAGVKLHKTTDGGKTVTLNATQTIHDDVHAIWIDPANSNHVIIGNDGGVAISWDMTKTWNFVHNIPVGLFYHVSYDMATPYNICGGMQDNYIWCGPSAVRGAVGIAGFNWATMQGGDGFVALQDPTDYRIAYSESQDGNMVRIDRVTGETISIRPQPNAGEPALRWNWDTPLVMSPHDPKVIYAAAQQGVPLGQPRPELGDAGLRSHQQRQPRRHRHDGREGQRHPHREGRRHPGVADDHLVRRVGQARRRRLRRHRRRASAGVARRRPIVDRRHRQDSRTAEGHLGVRGRAVAVRRRHRLRDVRRPSAERLRDLHLREPRFRADVAVGGRQPQGRGRSRR